MVFLELHLMENGEKILLNTDRINSIYEKEWVVNVCIGKVVYRVEEDYEDIMKCMKRLKGVISIEEKVR